MGSYLLQRVAAFVVKRQVATCSNTHQRVRWCILLILAPLFTSVLGPWRTACCTDPAPTSTFRELVSTSTFRKFVSGVAEGGMCMTCISKFAMVVNYAINTNISNSPTDSQQLRQRKIPRSYRAHIGLLCHSYHPRCLAAEYVPLSPGSEHSKISIVDLGIHPSARD